jgi:hypothetical protein
MTTFAVAAMAAPYVLMLPDAEKKGYKPFVIFWRRGGDSNPR